MNGDRWGVVSRGECFFWRGALWPTASGDTGSRYWSPLWRRCGVVKAKAAKRRRRYSLSSARQCNNNTRAHTRTGFASTSTPVSVTYVPHQSRHTALWVGRCTARRWWRSAWPPWWRARWRTPAPVGRWTAVFTTRSSGSCTATRTRPQPTLRPTSLPIRHRCRHCRYRRRRQVPTHKATLYYMVLEQSKLYSILASVV